MQAPLAVYVLRTDFEEGEDFLVYKFESDSVTPPYSHAIRQVGQADLRGVIHAANSVCLSMMGQPAQTLSLSVSLSSSSLLHVSVAFLDLSFALFVAVFPSDVPLSATQAATKTFYDVAVTTLGPAVPELTTWGATPDDLSSNLDPVLQHCFDLCAGTALPRVSNMSPYVTTSLGVPCVSTVRLPPALSSQCESVLTAIQISVQTELQTSVDGSPLCLPVGAALWHEGRIVACQLPPLHIANAAHVMAMHSVFQRSVASASTSFHADLHTVVDDASVTLCRASDIPPSATPPSDGRWSHPHAAFMQSFVLSVAAVANTAVCLVMRRRADPSSEMDPYWKDVLMSAVTDAQSSGLLSQLTTTIAATTPVAGPVPPPQFGLSTADTSPTSPVPSSPDTAAMRLVTTGNTNALMQYVGVDAWSGCVVQPLPATTAARATPPSVPVNPWDDTVRREFERTVVQLRATLHRMRSLSACSAPTPSSSTFPALPSSLFSPPSRPSIGGVSGAPSTSSPPAPTSLLSPSAEACIPEAGQLLMKGGGVPHSEFGLTEFDPLPSDEGGPPGGAGTGGLGVGVGVSGVGGGGGGGGGGSELGHADSSAFTDRDKTVEAAQSLPGAVEAGVRLRLPGTSPGFKYWVVGRLLPPSQEFYVCYDASTSQDVVELAFRVGLGAM